MSRYELNKLSNIVMKAAKAAYDNKKFPVGVLAVKAKRLAEIYPTDSTVVGCSNFLRRRADSKEVLISRAELKSIYNRLYSNNNKFAASFKEELGLTEVNPVKKMSRDPKEGENIVSEAYKKIANPLLSEQLESVLLKDKSLKLYSKETAQRAKAVCARELRNCGALPKQLSVVAGQSDILICQAAYDTPKGKTHIIIPVEIKNEKALLPSMFLCEGGFVGLSEETLKNYINISAGKNYKLDVRGLLKIISEAKNGKPQELSEVEQIVMKAASARGTSVAQGMNSVIMQEVDLDSPNIETPTVEVPDEIKSIAAMLLSDAGAAEMVFGKTLVEGGRNLVINTMRGAGYSSVQVVVSNNTADSISYAVAVDGGFGFNMPVKVVNNKPYLSDILVSAGRAFEMSPAGISKLLSEVGSDGTAVAKVSCHYGLRPSELVDRVKLAMNEDNYEVAEDALHVLSESGDDVAYKAGYDLYVKGLHGYLQAKETACDAQVKLASSKYMICSHTRLPTHQVYQDERGICRPLYRKRMEESSEGNGVSFIQSRVYFD